MNLKFPPLSGGVSQGLNDAGIETFEGDYAYYVARECTQNSLDASTPRPRIDLRSYRSGMKTYDCTFMLKNATATLLNEFIANLCNEEEYDPDEGRWTFKSGGDCGRRTDSASKVATAFSGRVMGYNSSENPSAQIGCESCEGHDFAVVAERFIVDYWAFRVARSIPKPVLDTKNPDEQEFVRPFYGNEKTWEAILC